MGMRRWTAAAGVLCVLGQAAPVLAADNPAKPGPSIWGEMDTWNRPLKATLQRSRQAPTQSFAEQVLVDIWAADDNWKAIADGLDKVLAATGLSPRYLEVKGIASPLVEALGSGPKIAIIGSTRRFTPAEAVALAQYAADGGRVLLLAFATGGYSVRLVDINLLMSQFEMTASLGRREGIATVEPGTPAEGLGGLPKLGAGVALWSTRATPVATVEGRSLASVVDEEGLRVVALDGRTLLSAKGDGTEEKALPGLAFSGLARTLVEWLKAG